MKHVSFINDSAGGRAGLHYDYAIWFGSTRLTSSDVYRRAHDVTDAQLVPAHPELPRPALRTNLDCGGHKPGHVIDGGHGHDGPAPLSVGLDDLGCCVADICQVVALSRECLSGANVEGSQAAGSHPLVQHAAREDGEAHGVRGGRLLGMRLLLLVMMMLVILRLCQLSEAVQCLRGAAVKRIVGSRRPARQGALELGGHESADAREVGGVDQVKLRLAWYCRYDEVDALKRVAELLDVREVHHGHLCPQGLELRVLLCGSVVSILLSCKGARLSEARGSVRLDWVWLLCFSLG